MEDRILEVIKIYSRLTGKNIIPKDTHYKRTYQYRYAYKFCERMKDVPWETVKKIIYHAAKYAGEHKNTTMWTRGLWILTKSNILDIVIERVKKQESTQDNELVKLSENRKFLEKNNFELNSGPEGGFPNIVRWFNDGKICLTYIAMSESCARAMLNLDNSDKSMLPTSKEISLRRIKCMTDKDLNKKIKNILNSDYIKLGE